MKDVEVFYIDRHGRKVYTYCTINDFTEIVTELLELALDKGVKVMYTYANETHEIDYWNLPRLQ